MALTDFFRINLPYGIARNEQGEWMAFNREYLPLGHRDTKSKFDLNKEEDHPAYTKYNGLTEAFLIKLAAKDGTAINRNDAGEIVKVWFYDDGSNPRNQATEKAELWDRYFEKIKLLSKKEVKR